MLTATITVTLNLPAFITFILDPAIADRMESTGTAMVGIAQSIVPVKTGVLKASIAYRYDRMARRLEVFAATPYANWVECGNRRQSPQPYLRPSLRAVAPSWGAV